MKRRDVLLGAASLAMPRIAASAESRVLKFVPHADLASVDPVQSPAMVTIMHALMVYDMLYGFDDQYRPQPQMVAGHVVENDGRIWNLTLRDGLRFHDGTPVLARDAVASIQRWAKRDGFGVTLFNAVDEISAPSDNVIRFRLRKPFPLLPDSMAKIGAYGCFVMPERLARTEPTTQVAEVVGSGPYRYVAAERLPGSRNVYARFDGYVPRPGGAPNFLSGPKVANFDRVEWHTIPDAATAAAALQAGEIDWWDQPTTDFIPVMRRNPALKLQVHDTTGFMAMLRPNQVQPPFDNQGVRRALMGAISQADYLIAINGEDRAMWRDRVGFFHPNSPLASDAGMEALTGPRDPERVRRDLKAAGYAGEKVVILGATDLPSLNTMALVATDMMKKVGMNVDYVATDWGTITQRFLSKEPVDKGGWSIWTNFMFGISGVNPAANNYIRGNGPQGMAGWPTSSRLEELRLAWMDAPDLDAQKRICRELQVQAFQDVPHYPLGLFYQATAFRANLDGVLKGVALFYNVRRT